MLEHSIESKFDMNINGQRSDYIADFIVHKSVLFLDDTFNFLYFTTYSLKNFEVHFAIVKLNKSDQN